MDSDNLNECCKKSWDLAVKYDEAKERETKISTVHDVCAMLRRVSPERHEGVIAVIKAYYKVTPPQSDEGAEG